MDLDRLRDSGVDVVAGPYVVLLSESVTDAFRGG